MDLAIFSGQPHFSTPQHVGGPIVEPETRERFYRIADTAFQRNYLTNAGPLTRELEEAVAVRHGAVDAVFMTNATLAQMVAMKAMGLSRGEALVAADTFIATAHVCEWLGLTPVFCDIDQESLNLSIDDFLSRITPDTVVVVPTHVFGRFADMPGICSAASEKGIAVIADAAHAFDCDLGGTAAGGFGVPEFISFHATKFFSTLEGGAVLTNDASLAREMRELRNFGFDRPDDAGKLGINAKASEISAAFGLASLPALPERLERLKAVRDAYVDELAGVPGLRIHQVDATGRNNYRYFALFLDEAYGVPRDAVYHLLRRENVLVRLYFYPGCHRMGHYAGRSQPVLPNDDKALGRILALPTAFVEVGALRSAREIARILKTVHERADAVREWWRSERTRLEAAPPA